MSILLTVALVSGGILVGRWLARGTRTPAKETTDERPKEEPTKKLDTIMEPFAFGLGDVLMRSGASAEEAWLAGAIVLCEIRGDGKDDLEPVAAIFVAPDAGGDRFILARPKPNDSITWMTAADVGVPPGEPPSSLEVDGVSFERTRRLPLRALTRGSGAPETGDDVTLAEYTGPANGRIVLVAGKAAHAYRGTVLEAGMYDVLPSKPEA